QDSARYRVLRAGDSNRSCISSVGEGYDKADVCRVKYDLQGSPIFEASVPYEKSILTRCSSRGDLYGRFCNGTLGVHEGTQEVLAPSNRDSPGAARKPDCPDPGIGGCSIYLYPLLSTTMLRTKPSVLGRAPAP